MLSGLIATWQALVMVEANGNEECEARNRKQGRWELRTKRHTLGAQEEELWPAHWSTPRYTLHGPTASRHW
jgi:hypothetical protein